MKPLISSVSVRNSNQHDRAKIKINYVIPCSFFRKASLQICLHLTYYCAAIKNVWPDCCIFLIQICTFYLFVMHAIYEVSVVMINFSNDSMKAAYKKRRMYSRKYSNFLKIK